MLLSNPVVESFNIKCHGVVKDLPLLYFLLFLAFLPLLALFLALLALFLFSGATEHFLRDVGLGGHLADRQGDRLLRSP